MTDSAAVLAYQAWVDGDADELSTLRALTAALDCADRTIAAGEGQRALWRKRIQEVVEHLGGTASVDGLADYRVTEPYTVISYERQAVDELMHLALAAGDMHTAKALEDARRVTERPGNLQIRKIKAR